MTEHTPEIAAPGSPGIVRQALAFIKHPVAIRPTAEPLRVQIKPLLTLLALNVVVLFAMLPLLGVWNKSVGIETPKLILDKNSPLLIVAVIFLLPPLEEIVFRGWQTGKPWQLLALLVAIATLASAILAGQTGQHVLVLPLAGLGLLLVALGVWKLRGRTQPPRWFARNFRWIFWVAAAVFAAAHYSNYEGVSLAHFPLVLPQLWAGLLLGFVRLRFGITRSMALHVSSNGLVVLISALTGWAGA